MENFKDLNLPNLDQKDLENINGGAIPAFWAAYYATQYLVAVYGATKVATAAGMAAGTATYAYVNT